VAKIPKFILSLIAIGLLLGTVTRPLTAAALKAEAPSEPVTQSESTQIESMQVTAQTESSPANQRPLQTIPEAFELMAENDIFQLFANAETLAFKLVDKRSGYVWNSNLDEKGEDDRLNRTWTAFAQSGISIDYLDQQAVDERASITNAEHTLDFQPTDQGFEATVTFTDASITVGVKVTLEAEGVRVEIPSESIKEESPDFKLGLLYVYPFFGATRGDSIPGYMFIPDGSGSLIRFTAQTKAKNMFYGRYYGADLGMITFVPFDPTVKRPFNLSIPVLGMVHEEKKNAYIAVVEKGAPYGEIHAHPAGIITNFNFLYNAFVYNESYFQATNRSGAGVTTLQQNTNDFDVSIHFRFLTGNDSDYVGMAKSYQQYLVEKGMLKKVSDTNEDIGIRLEFLGGEKEKVLFWYRLIPMTTVDQMAEILTDLDIQNTEVIYFGWQPLGASTMFPKSLKLDRKLGSKTQLRSLVENVLSEGGNFYLHYDAQVAFADSKGYSPRHDLAMSITNGNLRGYNYYLNLDALSERYSSLSQDVFSDVGARLSLFGIGSILYSDFKPGHFINRENTITAYQNLAGEQGDTTAFYMPNDYMFGYMNAYFDMPLTTSGYVYTTDTIPFLEIVLASYVPFYGPGLNFSSNAQEDLLRHADFGVYPSYFLTQEGTAKILNTPSSWLYTSSYGQWEQEVKQTYEWLNALLGPVKGQEVVAREVLEDGVIATTYGNGKQIIVNYTNQSFEAGDVTVNGKDAVIRDVEFP
jgi:hypothetical protein